MTGYVDHRIEGAASYQTNYIRRFRVYRGYGANSSGSCYIPPSEMRSDYSDIRFIGHDGAALAYCIDPDSPGTNYADFWVKFPYIPTTGTILKIVFGGGAIASGSNGKTTFPVYADFNTDSAMDTTVWTHIATGTAPAFSGGIVDISNSDSWCSTIKLPYTGISMEARFRFDTDSTNGSYYCGLSNDATSDWALCQCAASKKFSNKRSGSATELTRTTDVSSLSRMKICVDSSSASYYMSDSDSAEAFSATNSPQGSMGIFIGAYNSGRHTYVDWCFLRPWVNPEPSHGWWGSLEDL